MKTAEEWKKVYEQISSKLRASGLFGLALDKAHEYGFERFCKQIQLDAMKEGMRRAAEIAYKKHQEAILDCLCGSNAEENILTAAEQLTEKDL